LFNVFVYEGNSVAPPFANIFMFGLEFDFTSSFNALIYFTRYIDDIFFIVLSGYVDDFMRCLNDLCDGIVFTFQSGMSIDMLDMTIFADTNFSKTGLLSFKIFQKPINLYQYLSFFSDHPRAAKRGFVHGELLRYAIRSSTMGFFREIRKAFFTRLRVRGFPSSFLMPIFRAVTYDMRTAALYDVRAPRTSNSPAFLNLPFTRLMHRITPSGILHKHAHLLTEADPVVFPTTPLVVYSKGRTVFNLVRARQKRAHL
jgi:hypothetical protein